jgi:exopolysaccharide biosynthesis protein
VLWIAAIDDNGPGQGATLSQAAQLMIRLGASRAINLDGGGSTTLVYEGADGMPHLINVPKDGATSCAFPPKSTVNCERYVGVSFAIHARPNRPAP